MAHPTQPIGQYKKISSSRYYNSVVMYYSEKRYLALELYKKKHYTKYSPEDVWAEIPVQYEYRPDKMSNEAFGTPDFWWRLMEVNGMKDIMEFKAGRNIRIPGDLLN